MNRKYSFLMIFFVAILISTVGFAQTNISRTGGASSHFGTIAVNQEGVIMVVWMEGPIYEGHEPEAGTLYYNVFRDGQWQGTPLHWAALCGQTDIVELLLAAGADSHAEDRRGRTPIEWAEEQGQKETAQLLRLHSAEE